MKKPSEPALDPARQGLMGNGDHDQTFGAVAPGGIMALAVVRGLRTAGWTRLASIVIACAVLAGALAIAASMIFG